MSTNLDFGEILFGMNTTFFTSETLISSKARTCIQVDPICSSRQDIKRQPPDTEDITTSLSIYHSKPFPALVSIGRSG